MKINDKRGATAQEFKTIGKGEVFECNKSIFMKIATEAEAVFYGKMSYNAFNLTTNRLDFFRADILVEKVECTLNIEG